MATKSEYEAIARVITFLFEKSNVTSVEIFDPHIKVKRDDYARIIGAVPDKPNQVIQLINNIQTNITIDNSTIIGQIIEDLERKGTGPIQTKEVKRKLERLSKEIEKPKPRWNVIKETILWALDFGKDLFIQLIPLLLKMRF